MIINIYFSFFIVTLLLSIYILISNKKMDTLFVAFATIVTLNCFGRYLVAASQTLEMALLGNKFIYIGGCYAPVTLILILISICKINVKKWVKVAMYIFPTIVMGFVLTVGKSDIYYKDVQLGHAKGYSYLIKTYGPLHKLYTIMMLVYIAILLYYIVYAFKSKNKVSYKTIAKMGGTRRRN